MTRLPSFLATARTGLTLGLSAVLAAMGPVATAATLNAGADGISTEVMVTATVLPTCSFTTPGASALNFGAVTKGSALIRSTTETTAKSADSGLKTASLISFRCNNNQPYTISFSDATGALGRLQPGAATEGFEGASYALEPSEAVFTIPLRTSASPFLIPATVWATTSFEAIGPGTSDHVLSLRGALNPLAVDQAPPGLYAGSFTVTVSPAAAKAY